MAATFTTILDEGVHEILLYFLGANQISILEIAFLNAGTLLEFYTYHAYAEITMGVGS